MNKFILVLLFYGLFYYVFENMFTFLTVDLFDKNKSWKEKLKLKVSIPSSFWMLIDGAVGGGLLSLLFLIPFNMLFIPHVIIACLAGGIIITSVELGSGYLLNIKFKLGLWDYGYSKIVIFGKTIKLNFLGQIELIHGLLWCALTYLFYLVNLLFK